MLFFHFRRRRRRRRRRGEGTSRQRCRARRFDTIKTPNSTTGATRKYLRRYRFGARHARAFWLPAGGINVPLTRRETSRRSGSVAGWRQYWNAAATLSPQAPLSPLPPPSALFLHPGLRVLYICLLHSKLETRRRVRADPGSERATSKRWRIAMNIDQPESKTRPPS